MKLPAYSPARLRPLELEACTVTERSSSESLQGPKLLPAHLLWHSLIRSRQKGRLLIALPALSLALVLNAKGQAIPAMKAPAQISGFATFTDAKPDFRHWGDEAVYGFSLGGMIQSHHIVGVELRGDLLRWGEGREHEESVSAGPRAALHLGRISPYVTVLGGYAHAWEWHDMPRKYAPKPKLDVGLGPKWTLCGGLDYRLSHHVSIRAGELGFSRIYATSHSLDQLNASAGIIFHL
jgi:hypothetical protein